MEMMQAEIRKERVEQYGSFLFCPDKNTLCFGRDSEDGNCKHPSCLLEDPEYIRKREEIEKRMKENNLREIEERGHKDETPSAPIRRQTKSKKELLEEEIKSKEAYARSLYRNNKPKRGDEVILEVIRLQAELRRLK